MLLIAVPSLLVVAVILERRRHRPSAPALPTLSNGTHPFHPTTLVVSIDGFRPQYLSSHAELVPNLLALGQAEHGMRAASMQPVFPTLTFPNHWALLTGMYPESHGIIANDFYAPDLKGEFRYSSKDSWDPSWWWGEPMWSVAERGGRKALNIMWPGPPTMGNGVSPSYFVPYKVGRSDWVLDGQRADNSRTSRRRATSWTRCCITSICRWTSDRRYFWLTSPTSTRRATREGQSRQTLSVRWNGQTSSSATLSPHSMRATSRRLWI